MEPESRSSVQPYDISDEGFSLKPKKRAPLPGWHQVGNAPDRAAFWRPWPTIPGSSRLIP